MSGNPYDNDVIKFPEPPPTPVKKTTKRKAAPKEE